MTESVAAVSVIIPTYNVEKYLRQCMDSVVNQTLKNIEIICVNDGSTDGCKEILDEYAQKDSRIKVIHKANAGYGAAMNDGIKSATGEYIGIVEPDDYIEIGMFETLYKAAKQNDLDIVKSDFYRFTGSGKSLEKTYNYVAREKENYNRVIDPKEEKNSFRFIMNTWSGIYRRSFIIENEIFHNETPGASFQDNGFYFKGFCNAKRLMILDKAFYMNRRDNPGSSVANREKVYCGNTEYEMIYQYLTDHKELYDNFIDVFMIKKYHTYIFNLKRIASHFRKEYLHRFSEEFRASMEKGELKQSVFTVTEWNNLMNIIRDADEYYYKIEQSRVKVSVILPVYNQEQYLGKCMDSLINQTLADIEIICVNDGSTDNSAQLLSEYAAKDARITIINTENKGAGAARNTGIKAACGEYLLFPDSDDWFEATMLERAYRRAKSDNADITIFKSIQYDNQTENIRPCTYSVRTDKLPKHRPFSVGSCECNVFRNIMGWAWDKLYKRSFVLNSGLSFQEQRTTNDMYFTYMSLFKAPRITTCGSYLYYQRRNVSSSLSATREKSWECFYSALTAVKQELVQMGIWEKYKPHFVDYALHSCLWNLTTLSEETGKLLYDRLINEWFNELEISGSPEDWFTNDNERKLYQLMCADDADYAKVIAEYRKLYGDSRSNTITESVKFELFENDDGAYSREAEYYKNCLEETRKSLSYKVGRAITWLPRKIRGW